MNPIVRNVLAVIAGIIIGGALNMGLIMISGKVIPPPQGADVTTMEGLKASMHLFEPKHFIFPFLAHALGTLVGAFMAAKIAVARNRQLGMLVGFFFLAGGVFNVFALPSPLWFSVLDLVLAYLPMAWLGGKLAMR